MEHHQADTWRAGCGCEGALRHLEAAGRAEPLSQGEAYSTGGFGIVPTPDGARDNPTVVQLRSAAC